MEEANKGSRSGIAVTADPGHAHPRPTTPIESWAVGQASPELRRAGHPRRRLRASGSVAAAGSRRPRRRERTVKDSAGGVPSSRRCSGLRAVARYLEVPRA
jgi:hypothetical protein